MATKNTILGTVPKSRGRYTEGDITTKWYYDNLPNNIPNKLVDNHNIWKDGISDATKKLVSNQIDVE